MTGYKGCCIVYGWLQGLLYRIWLATRVAVSYMAGYKGCCSVYGWLQGLLFRIWLDIRVAVPYMAGYKGCCIVYGWLQGLLFRIWLATRVAVLKCFNVTYTSSHYPYSDVSPLGSSCFHPFVNSGLFVIYYDSGLIAWVFLTALSRDLFYHIIIFQHSNCPERVRQWTVKGSGSGQ